MWSTHMVSIPTIIEHRVSKEGLGREGTKPPKGLSNMGEIHLILPCIGHPGLQGLEDLSAEPAGAGAEGGGTPLEKGTMWSYS